jgi:glycosyltransferase involved in cell wall biosynthesis
MRDELGASKKDVLDGIVGRLTEIKNHSLFLKAVALYKERFGTVRDERRVRFVILGDGNLREQLEKQTRELRLKDDVVFTGTRNDPENFYPALDIVALTSLNEGTPLTLVEAMANARPLIAMTVGGVIDLLGERAPGASFAREGEETDDFQVYEHGIGVRPLDAEAFAGGLAYLIAAGDSRLAMGERGRRFVEENYSKDRLLSDVLKLYQELAPEAEFQIPGSKFQVENKSSNLEPGT